MEQATGPRVEIEDVDEVGQPDPNFIDALNKRLNSLSNQHHPLSNLYHPFERFSHTEINRKEWLMKYKNKQQKPEIHATMDQLAKIVKKLVHKRCHVKSESQSHRESCEFCLYAKPYDKPEGISWTDVVFFPEPLWTFEYLELFHHLYIPVRNLLHVDQNYNKRLKYVILDYAQFTMLQAISEHLTESEKLEAHREILKNDIEFLGFLLEIYCELDALKQSRGTDEELQTISDTMDSLQM